MDENLEKLHEVDNLLVKLVDGEDLSAKEAEDLIYHIFAYDKDGLRFATWLSANHAKGETPEELIGFLNASKRLSTKIDCRSDPKKIIALSGTGGGKFKTINVSTCAGFVVAAAGYIIPNEVYFGVTSPTGSADVFTYFGVDFLNLSREKIEKTLEEVGICPIMNPFISPELRNRGVVAKKYFVDEGIRVKSPFHLVSNLQTPIDMRYRIYGCYSKRYLDTLANLFKELEFKRTLTFYADIGMPEISNVGKTTIVEQNSKEMKKYVVEPEDVGVVEAKEEDIKTGGKEQNIVDFVRILKGQEKGPKADLVAINAGAAFYALEDVSSIAEGTKKAQEILKEGGGYRKLEQLVSKIGSLELLKKITG